MTKKLKDKNVMIKIFALLSAIILWIYVQMVQNPDIEYTYANMTVNLINESLLEENNLMVMDSESGFKSGITVKCPRWNLNDLKDEDFVVYVDLSEIKSPGTVELPIKVRLNNDNIIITNKKPSSIKLQIEKIVTVQKPISFYLTGKLKEGYYTNDKLVSVEKETFSVKGPESIVNKIKEGVITVDTDGKDENFSDVYNIIPVDKEGTAVTGDKLTVLENAISASVAVYEKKVIPIIITGIDSSINYEIKPSGIEIAAPKDVIENLNEIKINNFSLLYSNVGYSQKINITLPEKAIMLTDVTPEIIIKEGHKKEE